MLSFYLFPHAITRLTGWLAVVVFFILFMLAHQNNYLFCATVASLPFIPSKPFLSLSLSHFLLLSFYFGVFCTFVWRWSAARFSIISFDNNYCEFLATCAFRIPNISQCCFCAWWTPLFLLFTIFLLFLSWFHFCWI